MAVVSLVLGGQAAAGRRARRAGSGRGRQRWVAAQPAGAGPGLQAAGQRVQRSPAHGHGGGCWLGLAVLCCGKWLGISEHALPRHTQPTPPPPGLMPPAAVAGLQGAPGRQAGVGGLGAMSLGMRTPSPCRVVGGASWPGLARPWTGPLGHSMPPRHTSARALPLGAPPADHIRQLQADLADPTKVVCAQTAPAVRVAIAEEFGLPPGATSAGQLVAALVRPRVGGGRRDGRGRGSRQLGPSTLTLPTHSRAPSLSPQRALHFDYVFDVALGADLTIMEEGAELLERMTARARGEAGAPLPLLTSCCPGWVSLVEKAHPDLIPHLSTCRSPHMMLGRVLKAYFAPAAGIDPANLVVCRRALFFCVLVRSVDKCWVAGDGKGCTEHLPSPAPRLLASCRACANRARPTARGTRWSVSATLTT